MAVKYAVANGNWSAGATWNGGTIPVTGDDVYSNNFRVTINVATVDAAFLTNASLASPVINSGGGFTTSVNCTISANVVWGSASNVVANKLLIISTGNTVNMTGTITNGPVTATSATTAPIVEVLAGATLNYNGGALVNTGTVASNGFYFIINNGTTNINADITNYNGYNINAPFMIINNNNVQTLTITGNLTNRNSAGGMILQGINNTINIIGNLIFNVQISSYGLVNLTGTDPVNNTYLNFSGNIIHNYTSGITALYTNQSSEPKYIVTLNIGTFTRTWATGNYLHMSRGTVNVTTNALFGDNFGGILYYIYGGTNNTINFTGNLKGSHVGTGTRALAVNTGSIGLNLNIYGNIEGGDSTSSNTTSDPANVNYGVYISNSTITLDGNIVAIGSSLSENPGLFARASQNLFIKRAVTGAAPWYTFPYIGWIRFKTTAPEFQVSKQDNTVATLSDPALQDYPSINNVRQGVTYGFLSYTGNLIVPPPANVSAGYNYDSSGSVTGTAVLTPNDLFTAIATSSDPVAERLRNVSTVQITGDQLQAAFNT